MAVPYVMTHQPCLIQDELDSNNHKHIHAASHIYYYSHIPIFIPNPMMAGVPIVQQVLVSLLAWFEYLLLRICVFCK